MSFYIEISCFYCICAITFWSILEKLYFLLLSYWNGEWFYCNKIKQISTNISILSFITMSSNTRQNHTTSLFTSYDWSVHLRCGYNNSVRKYKWWLHINTIVIRADLNSVLLKMLDSKNIWFTTIYIWMRRKFDRLCG